MALNTCTILRWSQGVSPRAAVVSGLKCPESAALSRFQFSGSAPITTSRASANTASTAALPGTSARPVRPLSVSNSTTVRRA